MSHSILAALGVMVLGAIIMGCQSCHRAVKNGDLRKCKNVPAVIADAKLLRYKYTLSGTMRYPLHSEEVEVCHDDSSLCVIRLFDESRITDDNFDSDGQPLPDSLTTSAEVLDTIKQMIIRAKAWRFKDDYSPHEETKDGTSWGYTATFAVTDSVLAATHEEKRPRLLRNGGCKLSSGGCNASPDTELFEQVRTYLRGIYDSRK